jgi:ABC-type uncharacterized transport system permease subunit
MNAVKNARIIAISVKLQLKKLLEYKINLVFDLILRLADGAVFFLFWAVLLGTSSNIAGWDFKGFLLIFAFESFFISIVSSFGYASISVYESIHKAKIDNFLSKPANTALLAVMENLSISYSGYIVGAIALIIAAMQGIQINALVLSISLLMVFFGTLITCFFGLTLATLSFWLGRMDSIQEIFESFWNFQGKPANIFPIGLQALIAFTFPFIFVQTIPAMAILEKIQFSELLTALGIEIAILAAWFFAFNFLWKKGVKHYESGGG